jgi:hypothetical protein
MFDIVQKEKSWVPGPIYQPHTDWKEQLLKGNNKGKFGTYRRSTFTDSVMQSEAKKVAPNLYETAHYKHNKPTGALNL